jgi:hypothetical protein
MHRLFITALACVICLNVTSQVKLEQIIGDKVQNSIQIKKELSEDDVKQGLTEALTIGSQFAVNKVSSENGFNGTPSIRILVPSEANKMKETLIKMGFKQTVDDFELSMNRAAELASKDALDILLTAIKNMNIKDAFYILTGEQNSATEYLRQETTDFLHQLLKPIVISAMSDIEVAKKWDVVTTRYNSIPFTKKINPDLEDYITYKTIDGLFVFIAVQENEIRNKPLARTSEILKNVFEN